MMAKWTRKVAKETLGKSRGFGPKGRESWWWVASVIKLKLKKGML